MKTAVVTVVHHRGTHLDNQRAAMCLGSTLPDVHVVVALDDPSVRARLEDPDLPTELVECGAADGRLPLAGARNLGAAAALRLGAELLIFLDVDCLPGATLVERYRLAAAQPAHAGALLCGPVTYLPPPPLRGYPLRHLDALSDPHPARPHPAGYDIDVGFDYDLFWSLSFAVRAPVWSALGGFCESYRGYGGEDTDFGQLAKLGSIPLRWIGGAEAFHQYHRISDPPVEHLDDILRNAEVFHERWGWWPMSGWLRDFEALGLITRDRAGRPRRSVSGSCV